MGSGMASIDEAKIREIVAQVVADMAPATTTTAPPARAAGEGVTGHGVFDTPDQAVQGRFELIRSLFAFPSLSRRRLALVMALALGAVVTRVRSETTEG